LFEPAGSALVSERRTGFSEIDIVLQFFSTVEAQGANDRFQVRNGDGAMTEIGAKRTFARCFSDVRSWPRLCGKSRWFALWRAEAQSEPVPLGFGAHRLTGAHIRRLLRGSTGPVDG
jgi:hypothetical protein